MAARFVFGREPLRALAECYRDGRGIDMFSSVILDFGRGQHAIFAVSLAQASAQNLQVVCERAYIDLPKAYVPSRTEPNLIHIDLSQDHAKSDLTTLSFDPLDQYEAEVTNFSRARPGRGRAVLRARRRPRQHGGDRCHLRIRPQGQLGSGGGGVTMPTNFAIIGAGRIANVHAGALRANPDAELVAVADALPGAARSLCREVGLCGTRCRGNRRPIPR